MKKNIMVMMCALCAVVILTGCESKEEKQSKENFSKLESLLTTDVKKYFEDNVLGYVYPPSSCYEVTINQMQNAGIDVSSYVSGKCIVDKTAAFVVVTDSSDSNNIKYEIVPNLSCGNNSSKITDTQKALNQCVSTYSNK